MSGTDRPGVRERTRTVEQLAQNLRVDSDAFRDTFEAFEEALLLFDPAQRMLAANTAARRLLDTEIADELKDLVGQAQGAGQTCDRTLTENGQTLHARAHIVGAGRVLIYVRDITEERDDEMRRLQAEKMASIGMLAAGVAHEINNPAAFVLGNLEVLATHLRQIEDRLDRFPDGSPRAELRGLLFETAAILQESKEGMARIHRIVKDLSSFSHVDDDAATLADPNAVVESTLTILRNELRHRATVERELRATSLVRAGLARLGQVLLNLVVNAAQALEAPDIRRNRILVRTFDQDNSVIFEVTDNGTGIAPDVLPRIFDSFFTTKPRGTGTGLGLSISQGIIRSLGGELTVDSQLGHGSTFRVRLPAAASRRAEPARIEVPPHEYQRRRILAIDDEALLLKAYRRMLGDVHEVTTALGGRDALRVIEKRRDFDVILCDLQMPEMSGMEFFDVLQEKFPDLAERVVFATGGAFSPDARRFLERAVTCITKPFRIDDLLALINERCGVPTGAQPSQAMDDGVTARPGERSRS